MLDPIVLRWAIAILVLSLLPLLASGWRYHGAPRMPVTFAVGLFSGATAGAVQIAGPPVILYWLGRGDRAVTVRANLMVFFMICGVVLIASYAIEGLFTAPSLALSLLLGIPYMIGARHPAHGFSSGTSDLVYRRIAYLIIAAAAAPEPAAP